VTSKAGSAAPSNPEHRGDRLAEDWLVVVGAHGGAGASTLALGLSDALAKLDRSVRLIEAAHPSRSGLLAAATAEMGFDETGSWRRGTRGVVEILRRATDDSPSGWPETSSMSADTIVDLGHPMPTGLTRLIEDGPLIVVVFHATIPGARMAEQMLTALGRVPALGAAVGAKRWPGEVLASAGPRLRELRDAGQVVAVDEDRRLRMTGPSHEPLPKAVAAASARLLHLIYGDSLTPTRTPASGPRWHVPEGRAR
jgi:hypothetical protein